MGCRQHNAQECERQDITAGNARNTVKVQSRQQEAEVLTDQLEAFLLHELVARGIERGHQRRHWAATALQAPQAGRGEQRGVRNVRVALRAQLLRKRVLLRKGRPHEVRQHVADVGRALVPHVHGLLLRAQVRLQLQEVRLVGLEGLTLLRRKVGIVVDAEGEVNGADAFEYAQRVCLAFAHGRYSRLQRLVALELVLRDALLHLVVQIPRHTDGALHLILHVSRAVCQLLLHFFLFSVRFFLLFSGFLHV